MRVFLSHSSQDKPAVEVLKAALEERGFEVWLDRYEIDPGTNFIAQINAGLDECGAGIAVLSEHSAQSPWVEAEVSYLTYASIREGKAFVPIVLGNDPYVPPLLRPITHLRIEEVEAIAEALRTRRAKWDEIQASPPPKQALGVTSSDNVEHVRIALTRSGDSGIDVQVQLQGHEIGGRTFEALPAAIVSARNAYWQGFRVGIRRDPNAAERAALESTVVELGRALRELCLPEHSGEALQELVEVCTVGRTVEITFEAGDCDLLSLPFEALRLPDDTLLATAPPVVVLRRPAGLQVPAVPPPPGPIKVLIAVGAPDEGQTRGAVLDLERELGHILNAVEAVQRGKGVEVRILEVGHPEVIAAAVERDLYHVLHVSCHGSPGTLELEDEEGRAVPTTASELLDPIRETGRPLPLVFLNSCHGGRNEEDAASFAEALLQAGVPFVLAMQTSVSDHYATELARSFYGHLARETPPRPSRALARARKELEKARLKNAQSGEPLWKTQPEYATPALYVAGDERALANLNEKEPLRERPVHRMVSQVPQLRVDELVGRRRELRGTLRTLRSPEGGLAGVVLTGIGGVGKSCVAGRAMRRLAEGGFLVPTHRGRFDLAAIARSIGGELVTAEDQRLAALGSQLVNEQLDDQVRLQLVAKSLAEAPIVLVLDDFERNLTEGGGAFLDELSGSSSIQQYLLLLARHAQSGRLLVTCRYPIPGLDAHLHRVPIGPLSAAESRKLLQRLPELRDREPADLALVMRTIGGHPRMLEFLDALLNQGSGRLAHVTEKLREVLKRANSSEATVSSLSEGLQQTVLLGARDVFLGELLAIAKAEGNDEVLLQLSVSNLPVSTGGLAHMLAGEPADPEPIERALERLAEQSLVHRFPTGSAWVHRWTAEGLADRTESGVHLERHNRAGRYRLWRVRNESHSLWDVEEAVRNYLAGADFDAATPIALACFEARKRLGQTLQVAALAGEILESLPTHHDGFASIADAEATSHLALGFTNRAMSRYLTLLQAHEERVAAEPDRADYQRDLSVSHNKMGRLYITLGQGERARGAFERSLAIRERLAAAEPGHAEYQRDLSVSHNNMGDLYVALGQAEEALNSFKQALAIAERLAAAEPDRADYQHDLSVSYEKMGSLYVTLRQREKARGALEQSLAIAERLAAADPDRAEYQRDLSVSYEKMGSLYAALGQGEKALSAFEKSLLIAEQLAAAEPDRVDYQRDLSVANGKLGQLLLALGRHEEATETLAKDLALAERIADAEPENAGYQVDLAFSLTRRARVHPSTAPEALARAEAILVGLQEQGRLARQWEALLARVREQRKLSDSEA